MKSLSSLLIASLVGIPVVLMSTPSYAGWRCTETPGFPECEDQILNDIEDTTVADWPSPASYSMPSIPWRCQEVEHCPHCLTSDPPAVSNISKSGNISWTVTWLGSMNSFLLGQTTASASLSGSVSVHTSASEVADPVWSAGLGFSFAPAAWEVTSPSGATGVTDLGSVTAFPSGPFWTATIPLALTAPSGATSCTIGGRAALRGAGNIYRVDYPVNSLAVTNAIAEGVRNQFRTAVRIVVTGAP